MFRWIGFVLLVLLLALTAFTGLIGGLGQIRRVAGVGQWTAATAQLTYGVCAVLSLAAMGARHRAAKWFIYTWCVATIVISSLAPVVYGGAPIAAGFASGVGATLAALLVLWIWRNRPSGLNA
jgi:hypothetical protein